MSLEVRMEEELNGWDEELADPSSFLQVVLQTPAVKDIKHEEEEEEEDEEGEEMDISNSSCDSSIANFNFFQNSHFLQKHEVDEENLNEDNHEGGGAMDLVNKEMGNCLKSSCDKRTTSNKAQFTSFKEFSDLMNKATENKITVRLSQHTDRKKKWTKCQYCLYCKKGFTNLSKHYLQFHREKEDVKEAINFSKNSCERKILLEKLRNMGNFCYNLKVLKEGKGEIIPWRCPSEAVSASLYFPCLHCYGFFQKKDLWRHKGSCNLTKFWHKDKTKIKSSKSNNLVPSKARIKSIEVNDEKSQLRRSFRNYRKNDKHKFRSCEIYIKEEEEKLKNIKKVKMSSNKNCIPSEDDIENTHLERTFPKMLEVYSPKLDSVNNECARINDSAKDLNPEICHHTNNLEGNEKTGTAPDHVQKGVDYCFFCSKGYSDLKRHYYRKHPKKKEVARIMKSTRNSVKRKYLLEKLINLGNFCYVRRVLEKTKDIEIPWLSDSNNLSSLAQYHSCLYCFGFFRKNQLSNHADSCFFNSDKNCLPSFIESVDCSDYKQITVSLLRTDIEKDVKSNSYPKAKNKNVESGVSEDKSSSAVENVGNSVVAGVSAIMKFLHGDTKPQKKEKNMTEAYYFCQESYLEGFLKMTAFTDILSKSVLHEEVASLEDFQHFVEAASSNDIIVRQIQNANNDTGVWRKCQYCLFCHKGYTNITKHFFRCHKTMIEVLQIGNFPKLSFVRKLLLEKLRNLGNFYHNCRVLKRGEGEIIPWRCPAEFMPASLYSPCQFCFGFFQTKEFSKHYLNCSFNMDNIIALANKDVGALAPDDCETLDDDEEEEEGECETLDDDCGTVVPDSCEPLVVPD